MSSKRGYDRPGAGSSHPSSGDGGSANGDDMDGCVVLLVSVLSFFSGVGTWGALLLSA